MGLPDEELVIDVDPDAREGGTESPLGRWREGRSPSAMQCVGRPCAVGIAATVGLVLSSLLYLGTAFLLAGVVAAAVTLTIALAGWRWSKGTEEGQTSYFGYYRTGSDVVLRALVSLLSREEIPFRRTTMDVEDGQVVEDRFELTGPEGTDGSIVVYHFHDVEGGDYTPVELRVPAGSGTPAHVLQGLLDRAVLSA